MKKLFRTILSCTTASILAACGAGDQSQTGAIPLLVEPPYPEPSNIDVKRAYISGFKSRYDIPLLEYPQEIQDRLQAERVKRLGADKQLFELNVKVVSAALESKSVGRLTGNDKSLAKTFLQEYESGNIEELMRGSTEMMEFMTKTTKIARGQDAKSVAAHKRKYRKLVRLYPGRVTRVTAEDCKWREVRHLIGGGVDQMEIAHGEKHRQAYDCPITITLKSSNGYKREWDGSGYFIKSTETEGWLYYGTFLDVGVKPHRQMLNPEVLKNPERALRQMSVFDQMDL